MPGLFDDFGRNLGGLLGNLGTAGQNFLQSPTIAQGIGNAIRGATTGQATDEIGATQQLQQQMAQVLLQNGVPRERVLLAIQSPEAFKAELGRIYPTFEKGEAGGNLVYTNPRDPTQSYPVISAPPQVTPLQAGTVPFVGQQSQFPQSAQRPAIQGSALPPPTGAAGPMPLPQAGPPMQQAPLGPPAGATPQLPLGPPMSLQQKNAEIAQGTAQGKAAAALPNTMQSIDLALGTLDKIENHPARNDRLASGIGAMLPDVVPAIVDKNALNYRDLVSQFKNQLYTLGAQSMRGLGSLSNTEGKNLIGASQNIDLRQSPEKIAQAVQDAKNLLTASRKNAQSVATGSGEYTSPVAPRSEPSQQQDGGWTQITPNIRVRPKQ